MPIQHDAASHRFTSGPAAQPAELIYTLPEPGIIDFVHTFVPAARRGQGLAEQLAEAGLAYARQQHLRVRTSCEFMNAYVRKEGMTSD